jgi:hypothetical protein
LHRIKGSINYIQKLLFRDLAEEQELSDRKESLKKEKKHLSRLKKFNTLAEFPTIISHEESKIFLHKICQKKGYEIPEYQILDMVLRFGL